MQTAGRGQAVKERKAGSGAPSACPVMLHRARPRTPVDGACQKWSHTVPVNGALDKAPCAMPARTRPQKARPCSLASQAHAPSQAQEFQETAFSNLQPRRRRPGNTEQLFYR